MRRKRILIAFALFAAVTAATIVGIQVGAQPGPPGSSIPDVVPIQSPADNQAAIDTFSWEMFLALNRPALLDSTGRPVRDNAFPMGKPDLSKPLDAPGPRVWEGLKADHELFRHDGKAPVAWNEYDDDLPCSVGEIQEKSGEKILTLTSEGTSMQQGINQAMAGPLMDQKGMFIHYEVRHNEPYYNFVKDHKLYLKSELNKHRWPRKMIELPISDPAARQYGSLEVKAAWRVLDPSDDASRYYWTMARIPDPVTGKCGPKQRVALVGLHVIAKVKGFNSWLWATFEHVDNVPCNFSDPGTCPPAPAQYSFNAKNLQLDADARARRGYAPLNWVATSTAAPSGDHWRPVDPKKLPPEPVRKENIVNAVRMTPVQPEATKQNAAFHQLPGVAGTIWANYILIDTQWPTRGNDQVKPPNVGVGATPAEWNDGSLNPIPGPTARNVPVANITMETYYQVTNPSLPNLGASCMQCHYAAAQTDFSWTLTNRSYPPTLATKPTP